MKVNILVSKLELEISS